MTDIVSTSATTTPDVGRTTFSTYVRDIATYYGMDRDDEKEEWIKRIVYDVIDDLNTKKLWRFNLQTAADITTSSGTATYSVPADLWRIYNARKTDSPDFTLSGTSQHELDIIFSAQSGITGYPYCQVDFNIYRDGTIKLFPTPDGTYTISLRYFSLILKPSAGNETLNVPPPFQVVPKYGALARLGAMVGDRGASLYWEAKFQEAYADMNRMDENIGDRDLRFINVEEAASRISYTNPAARPRYYDIY